MNHFTDAIKFRLQSAGRRSERARREIGERDLTAVDPRETDPRISQWTEPHWIAINPEVRHRDQLFVFFSGSFASGDRLKSLLLCAADLGYHAINLRYPNSWTVGDLCRNSEDPDSHEKIRLEIAEGTRGQLPLGPGDSIVSRLTMLLRWLHANRPGEGWDGFVDSRSVRWEKLVLSGHSQGSGHAALLGKRHGVHRVVMLGGPVDFNLASNTPAPWLSRTGKTPVQNYFGFTHARDQGFPRIELAWDLLGLGKMGPLANVDHIAPPYGGSHQLFSDLDVVNERFHASVATDAVTPRNGVGEVIYEPVWKYLLGAEPVI